MSTRLKCEGNIPGRCVIAPIRPTSLRRRSATQGASCMTESSGRRRAEACGRTVVSTAGLKKLRRRKPRSRLPLGVALQNAARATPVARSRGRASPTSARSARGARPRVACAASRSAMFWSELPPPTPPRTAAVQRDLQANQRRGANAYGHHNMCAGEFEKARNLEETRAFRRFRRNGSARIDSFDQQR